MNAIAGEPIVRDEFLMHKIDKGIESSRIHDPMTGEDKITFEFLGLKAKWRVGRRTEHGGAYWYAKRRAIRLIHDRLKEKSR